MTLNGSVLLLVGAWGGYGEVVTQSFQLASEYGIAQIKSSWSGSCPQL